MRRLTALLPFLVVPSALAQDSVPWLVTIDGGGPYSSEAARAVAFAPDGDVVIGGGRALTAPGLSYDPFLVRLAPDGTTRWTRSDPTAVSGDAVRSIAIAADGTILTLASPSAYNQVGLRLAKHDGAGALLWSTTHSAPASTTLAAGVVVDAAGNSYVAGAIGAAGPGNPAELLDLLIESRDASGNLRWSHLLDGGLGKGDLAHALAAAPGGEFVVVGTRNGLQSGACEAWIVRFDAAGNVLWSRSRATIPGGTHVYADGIVDASGTAYVRWYDAVPPSIVAQGVLAYDAAGNVLFERALPAGTSASDFDVRAGAIVLSGHQSGDAFAARYSTTGTPEWTRTWSYPGAASTQLSVVRIDAAGNAHFAGNTNMPDVQHTDTDLAYARWSPDGTQLASASLPAPGNANDRIDGLLVDASGGAIAVGSRRDVVGTAFGPADVLAVRIEPQSFPLCLGDGTGAACPCGNASATGTQSGCVNSAGLGARLTDSGAASVANDTLLLSVAGETPNAPTVVIQGTASAGSTAFGDGLRCAGGSVLRMYTRSASAGALAVPAPGDPSVAARAAALGQPIPAGAIRVYQSYYRDPNPSFCPAPAGNTWNLSNGLLVRWGA